MQNIAILGSTGSIGTQALEVIAANQHQFSVSALAAYQNDVLLEEQIEFFKPQIAVLVDKQSADRLVRRYKGQTTILCGQEGLLAAATQTKTNTVLTSLVGFAGLEPTLAAINAGKTIALANKETLVAAGELVTSLAAEKNVSILPVDSEHSAILQCLQGERRQNISRIILTASGGPFKGFTREQLEKVTVIDCLKHPNWSMGKKITIDSSTMVNKGLEVIEAKWLFSVDYDQIDVVIHPQSIVHSMVEYSDGAIIAQLGMPDMRLPIQYAFTFPDRNPSTFPRLDLTQMQPLSFYPPDNIAFPALQMAFRAGRTGGTLPCVFNAANEVAVASFLADKIRFLDITSLIHVTMEKHTTISRPTFGDIIAADAWARKYAEELIHDMHS
ncbi:MAG: 1-deoxy-D-xylulose 5-phosphate reductoisomerase [Firmicutes bacterium]|nr:1-deoxy-D-xylulose 5-phosphate reductoisomerase [Bacillota bacterium]